MATSFRLAASHLVGWLADRSVPRFLRVPFYRTYGKLTGCNLDECRPPLNGYGSLGAFFIRRLVDGARPILEDPGALVSPVDGTVQDVGPIGSDGAILQAKGRHYGLREFLAGIGECIPLEGGTAWTIYLSPRDYHRIHAPESCELLSVRWVAGDRFSVNPKVLLRRDVFAVNERCVLELATVHGPMLLVLVGALNVGRIRVIGVDPAHDGVLDAPRHFERGAELARFEMGSTIVLLAPAAVATPIAGITQGRTVQLGEGIGTFHKAAPSAQSSDHDVDSTPSVS
ncbi:MAG: phosphatidylserine decarboxylase [Planctomycetota bacterium]|jgi:phosphatidylserine decarboxylase